MQRTALSDERAASEGGWLRVRVRLRLHWCHQRIGKQQIYNLKLQLWRLQRAQEPPPRVPAKLLLLR